MDSPRIPAGLEKFLAHAESLHPSNNPKGENGFAKEFMQLKALSSQLRKEPGYSCHHGELECNRPKNRYKDIVPFDYNRITLPRIPGVVGSDYINGNYIKGPDGSISYLALQGPLPRTIDDFWRLIASHRCQVVIMVCKEVEMGKLKCKRYWPESQDEKLKFAGMDISLLSEEDLDEGFVMRRMKVKSSQDEMLVTQLQYTAWPDHDVPKSAAPLLEMNKTLSSLQGNKKQPILIHCSAGCGRTGTICAVDYAWALLKMQKTDNFSVFDVVSNLRRQRMAMVQTKEQYALVYKAVVHLVEEELNKDEIKSHTYVNVPVSTPLRSPQGNSSYDNPEFFKGVVRWKESDKQNGSVPKAPATATESKTDKSESKQRTTNEGSGGNNLGVERTNDINDYVNLQFPTRTGANNKFATVGQGTKPTVSAKPSFAKGDLDKRVLSANATKGGVRKEPNSPTVSDYEILAVPARQKSGSDTAIQRKKDSVGDYEVPPLSGSSVKKEEARHMAEGLLIDLGDEFPSLPDKRHSVGSSGYVNVSVIANATNSPGTSSNRAASVPNVLDDMLLSKNISSQPQNADSVVNDSKAFRTVPTRIKSSSGPKRFPLTAGSFEDPRESGENGFKVVQSPTKDTGDYSLVGATSPTFPNEVENPAFFAQWNQNLGSQKTNPLGKSPPKQVEKSRACSPVGEYYLLGIPGEGNQMPVLAESTPNIDLCKQNVSGVSKDTKQRSEMESSYALVGQPQQQPRKMSPTHAMTGSAQNSSVSTGTPGYPIAANRNPIIDTSYEVIGQKLQQPGKKSPVSSLAHAGGSCQDSLNDFSYAEVSKPTICPPNSDKDKPLRDKRESVPESRGSQTEGKELHVVQDVYAVVVKPSNSPNIPAKFVGSVPNLRSQTSSSSLKSRTSTSSEDSEDVPPVPKKTNDAYLAPGQEHYESVEQATKGTLGRFKMMMKSSPKVSLPKLLSNNLPSSIPRSNSSGSGSGVSKLFDDFGFNRRVSHPKGPRACPRNWPQLNL